MKKINFENLPSTNTPINATNLNLMQDNIEETFEMLGNNIKVITGEITTTTTSSYGIATVKLPEGFTFDNTYIISCLCKRPGSNNYGNNPGGTSFNKKILYSITTSGTISIQIYKTDGAFTDVETYGYKLVIGKY